LPENTEKLSGRGANALFLLALAVLAIAVLAAIGLADRESRRHAELYAEFEGASALMDEERYEEAYEIFGRLKSFYGDAYILELKQLDCEIGMNNADALFAHAQRALELNPLLARNSGFMNVLAFCYENAGDAASAQAIREYAAAYAAEGG
jgi:tetratricopeptide (TPR) repeat protein